MFGTAEEDARRRDFTINGLFYDLETGQVIDYVNGMADLEARLVRTIGDPDIRFREDPVRILRAVKFAARCNLTIEPETYRRMLDHAEEIQKCAQARVSEEIYRLLRAGAAKRSVELLLETTLLRQLIPSIDKALESPESDVEAPADQAALLGLPGGARSIDAAAGRPAVERADPGHAAVSPAARRASPRHQQHQQHRPVRHPGDRRAGRADQGLAPGQRPGLPHPAGDALHVRSATAGRRRLRLNGREFEADAHRLHEIVTDAEAQDPEIAGRPLLAEGETPTLSPEAEERLARELETPSEFERRRAVAAAAVARPRGRRRGAAAREGQPRPHPRRTWRATAPPRGASARPSPTWAGCATPTIRGCPSWAPAPSAAAGASRILDDCSRIAALSR